jgi:hypothetical protein
MKQSKHFVHFGLLFAFITLSVTGVIAYFLPFSLLNARLHIVFALFTLALVVYHLVQRYRYFLATLHKPNSKTLKLIFLLVLCWLLFFITSINNQFLGKALIENSYEGSHQREILRTSPHSATQIFDHTLKTVRSTGTSTNTNNLQTNKTAIVVEVRFPEIKQVHPAVAIWAESTTGSIIETLYLSPELAFTDMPTWHGEKTPRHHILPIWRNRFTLTTGLEPNGELDAFSGATANHQFNLEKFFVNKHDDYLLFIEINLPFDNNENFENKHLGQPSVVYSAYVEHSKKRSNALLELTGHGGTPADKGKIQYDLSSITTAQELIDVAIASTFNVNTNNKH